MSVKNQCGVSTHRPASAAADPHRPVNLTFYTRGPAATIRTVVSGVLAAPSSRPRRQLNAETCRLKRLVQPRLGSPRQRRSAP